MIPTDPTGAAELLDHEPPHEPASNLDANPRRRTSRRHPDADDRAVK